MILIFQWGNPGRHRYQSFIGIVNVWGRNFGSFGSGGGGPVGTSSNIPMGRRKRPFGIGFGG